MNKKINKWYLGVALFIGGYAIIGFGGLPWEKSLYFLALSAIFFLHSMKSQLPHKHYKRSELVLTILFLMIFVYAYVL